MARTGFRKKQFQNLKQAMHAAREAAASHSEKAEVRHRYAVKLYDLKKQEHDALLAERARLKLAGSSVPFSHRIRDWAFRFVRPVFDITGIGPVDEDEKVACYTDELQKLRSNGVTRITELNLEIVAAKKNRLLDDATKKKIIADHRARIKEARKDAALHRDTISWLSREAVAYVNALSSLNERQVNAREDEAIREARNTLAERVQSLSANGKRRKQEIRSSFKGKRSKTDRTALKDELAVGRYETNSMIYDARSDYRTIVNRSKAEKNQAFIDRVRKNRGLRNGVTRLSEDLRLSIKNYRLNFTLSRFLLANGLYLAIILFFIVCIVLAATSGAGNLFSLPNILTILEQASTRTFYALGVAGLILLTGTDLSVGRMVALGAVVTGLFLHPGKNIVTFFSMGPWDFVGIPMVLRLLMALALSIALCVMFSAFAGFFSARLMIHPFISTLATQLIIYGLLFFGTSGTPVGSIDSNIKDLLGGRWILGMMNGQMVTFPKLIIPAAIAVAVASFIWNKTTFGKEMYAVGGSPEAASVSGISVFRVTMGVFIMAGVFYGFGAFFEAFKANASAGTGQGYELDAIAACVVGGVSFYGGIGKISGAVIGVIIFTSLTYCLTFLGIDTNLQFVFKGLIIIAAVALDSVKYIKRK